MGIFSLPASNTVQTAPYSRRTTAHEGRVIPASAPAVNDGGEIQLFRELWRGEGRYRSSTDAREPQSPTKSEEHRRHLQ
eukprot:30911-Prorocentrum_minimum.AAC.1